MWSYLELARIENNWGQWSALVTLVRGGVPESFWLNFPAEPTPADAATAGQALAARKNTEAADAEFGATLGL